MGPRVAAALPMIILMLGCSSEEMPVEDTTVCEAFEPPATEGPGDSATPREVVEQITWGVRATLQCNQASYADNLDQLYDAFNEILLPRFDRQYAAQLALARNWRGASEEQRERFVNAFYPHFIQGYAGWMLWFNFEKLEVLPFEGDDTKKRVTVKTIMLLDDGTKVPMNYGMVKRDSGWLMFDVTIEGISYIRNFKAEVNAELQEKGLTGVIERLEADTAPAL